MKEIILINKKEGETPLAALSLFRKKHKKYKDVPMTYAGRLDPMASGVLLILAGDKVHEKDKYLSLDKEYTFEVLFGFATDTYDILGKVANIGDSVSKKNLKEKIKKVLPEFNGKIIQKYPLYSSRTVAGKPLFAYGREGEDVTLPEKEVEIKNLKFKGLKSISAKKLLFNIEKRIAKVEGDFRQEEILSIWKEKLTEVDSKNRFFIGSFKVVCTSGTYVRSIANSMGEKIQTPSLAFKIKRTKVFLSYR